MIVFCGFLVERQVQTIPGVTKLPMKMPRSPTKTVSNMCAWGWNVKKLYYQTFRRSRTRYESDFRRSYEHFQKQRYGPGGGASTLPSTVNLKTHSSEPDVLPFGALETVDVEGGRVWERRLKNTTLLYLFLSCTPFFYLFLINLHFIIQPIHTPLPHTIFYLFLFFSSLLFSSFLLLSNFSSSSSSFFY